MIQHDPIPKILSRRDPKCAPSFCCLAARLLSCTRLTSSASRDGLEGNITSPLLSLLRYPNHSTCDPLVQAQHLPRVQGGGEGGVRRLPGRHWPQEERGKAKEGWEASEAKGGPLEEAIVNFPPNNDMFSKILRNKRN